MVGNPQRYRAALQQLENRNATAGCLLALLLLLPLAARSVPVAVLSATVLIYVTLVVPLATGFLSASVVIGWFRICTAQHSLSVWQILRGFFSVIQHLHFTYLGLHRLHVTTSQAVFNLGTERLLCPDQPGSCIYALLLCSILAYVHNSFKSRRWSQLRINVVQTADDPGLTASVSSLVTARLAKAVILAFGLMTITDRLDSLQPGALFMMLCGTFFFVTQWPGIPGQQSAAVRLAAKFRLIYILGRRIAVNWEGLEPWWVPLAIRLSASISAAVLAVLCLWKEHLLLAVFLLYGAAGVPGLTAWCLCWPGLKAQLQLNRRFPFASAEQISDAGVCAVCLEGLDIQSSRTTPCHHVFHVKCIRECATRFGNCPLCKRVL